jgi:hypothetical protein
MKGLRSFLRTTTRPRFFVWKSKSGRSSVWPLGKMAFYFVAFLFFFIFIQLALTLYNPFLHKLGGDWTGLFFSDLEGIQQKVLQDQSAAIQNLLYTREVSTTSDLPTLSLELRSNAFEKLNKEILCFQRGELLSKPRVNGYFRSSSGSLTPVKVAYRGLSGWHHQFWKPSLRLEFPKNELVEHYRNHLLIAPESPSNLRNWLSNELAKDWGMLHTGEHFVRLFINQRYFGIYSRLWRLDESLLIQEKRLPGPFFRLELAPIPQKGSLYPTLYSEFWDPLSWEYTGVESRKEGESFIIELYKALKLPFGAEQFRAFDALIDSETMAKWLAIRCHSGELHIGGSNVAFYLDTCSGKMLPILMDPSGYDWAQPDLNLNRGLLSPHSMLLTQKCLQYPPFFSRYAEALHSLLQGQGSFKSVENKIRTQWQKVRPSALADLYTSEMGSRNTSYTRSLYPVTELDEDVNRLCHFISRRLKKLQAEFDSVKLWSPQHEENQFTLVLEGLHSVRIQHREGKPFHIQGIPQARSLFVLQTSLHKNAQALNLGTKTSLPLAYSSYTIEGKREDYSFSSTFTQETLSLSLPPKTSWTAYQKNEGIHPFSFIEAPTSPFVLGPGEVVISETQEYLGSVSILAGTTLLLGADVSLYFYDKVEVQGTKEAPVRIRPQDEKKPFGVFALIGSKTKGSSFSFLDCEGGSWARRYNLCFSGMFSVRDCPSLSFMHCRFGKNFLGDDTVHLVRCSQAFFTQCLFENAHSDAMDWDEVQGGIVYCKFQNNTNDGFDLSSGSAFLAHNEFIHCGDKGMSIGEGSYALITQCFSTENAYGLAVKDTSIAVVLNSHFKACSTGVAAYCKKWRWEKGGWISLQNSSIQHSKKWDLDGDSLSLLFLDKLPHDPPLKITPSTLYFETSKP